jgi:hypothetical protein
MVFRPTNPVTIVCEWCGVKSERKGSRAVRDGVFCGRKCSTNWHRQKDAETVHRLMELTRLLWEARPEGFRFEPRAFPGLGQYRTDLNAVGKWIREIGA